MERRKVFLFGAGAVIDWGGPTSKDLTKLVRKSGFFCKDLKTRISDFIYKKIVDSGYSKNQVNFETILHVIENLINFYAGKSNTDNVGLLNHLFFDIKDEEYLLNFSIENTSINSYKIKVPNKKNQLIYETNSTKFKSKKQAFYANLYSNLLSQIVNRISEYSYHCFSGISNILSSKNMELNKHYINWINSLSIDGSILRMYTLNYDRLFKILTLQGDINEIFEGFYDKTDVSPTNSKADLRRILNDESSHVHYNLHGCIYWSFTNDDFAVSQIPEIELTFHPNSQLNNDGFLQMSYDKSQNIVLSSIISGYQKIQRLFMSPIREMFYAFEKDLLKANELYIIGYSFSDNHINYLLKTAIHLNENLRLFIINSAFDEINNPENYKLLQNHFIYFFNDILHKFNYIKKDQFTTEYFSGKVVVISLKFKDFLSRFSSFSD